MKYFKVDFNISADNSNGKLLDENTFNNACDIIAALAGDAGFESFETCDGGITGYVQTSMFDEESLKSMIAFFPISDIKIEYAISEAEYKDWNSEWESKGFEPILIDDRCVIHDTMHNDVDKVPINITINARQAFGTGTHETTRMITRILLNSNLDGQKILDCGCGTGILSIVAMKNGAQSATGYDIDEWSVNNAMDNARINGIEFFKAFLGDCSLLENEEELISRGKFNTVMANINRNILLHDMPSFIKVMEKNGKLILSGFYENDAELIINEAGKLGMKECGRYTDNDWCCLIFQSSLLL